MTIESSEMDLPQNTRSKLAGAIWSALEFAGQFTDIIIHQDSAIHIKSVKGTVPLSAISPISNFTVTLKEIQAFYAHYVSKYINNTENDIKSVNVDKIWADEVQSKFTQGKSINESICTPKGIYIRHNLFQFQGGKVGMVVRVTHPPREIETNVSGIPKDLVEKIAKGTKGLLILTGPTSSGKTATALSILDYINRHSGGHIVTIEDPIEYIMPNEKAVFSQRGVGDDVSTFADGLREALRQCPDVLLVGEVRDRETAETAILASESGCLVIITTHGQTITGAMRKLTYLLGEQSARAMLAVMSGSLIGVVRQELVPIPNSNGYSLVCDVLNSTNKVRELIEKGAWNDLETLQKSLRSDDHSSMNNSLLTLVKEKKISKGDALRHSTNKLGMQEVLRQQGLL